MNANCCVPMCNSLKRRSPEISFHKLPAESERITVQTDLGIDEIISRRKVWINKLKISKRVSPFMRVCSLHFKETDFFRVIQRKKLKKTAIPSVKLPIAIHGTSGPTVCAGSSSRETRLILRNKAKKAAGLPIMEEPCSNLVEPEANIDEEPNNELEAANGLILLMQVDTPTVNCKTYRDFTVQVNTPANLTFCAFITSDSALSSLTGLNSQTMLEEILKGVDLIYQDERVHKVSIRERVILTFVKLKWNLNYTILGIFFGITPALCRTYILQMIKLLSSVLKAVIEFPSIAEIKQNMPNCFENFQDTQIVLDCTEIYTQISKCLCCRIRFYSHYKGAQTVIPR